MLHGDVMSKITSHLAESGLRVGAVFDRHEAITGRGGRDVCVSRDLELD